MSQIKVENIYTVTDEDIDDIMCSAFEGGITYWCGRVEVVGEYLGEYASEQISRGGELILWDAENDDESYRLNKEMLLEGIRLAIKNRDFEEYRWYENRWYENNGLDCTQVDADVADCIIQYALFGEVVFG